MNDKLLRLSTAEVDTLERLLKGEKIGAIAQAHNISLSGVSVRLTRAQKKVGAASPYQLVGMYAEQKASLKPQPQPFRIGKLPGPHNELDWEYDNRKHKKPEK